MTGSPDTWKAVAMAAALAVITAGSTPWWWPNLLSLFERTRLSECQDKWQSADLYGSCFDDLVNDMYPNKIEGRLTEEGVEQFRGHWIAYPGGKFAMLSCSVLSDKGLEIVRAAFRSCSGREEWHSSFTDRFAMTKHQGTWSAVEECVDACPR